MSRARILAMTTAVPLLLALTIAAPAGPVDVDKLHGGAGGWGTNFFDDLDFSGAHDPGEPFADNIQAGWINPASRADYSCWLATACNMLEQVGALPAGGAVNLYNNYALNGVPTAGGMLTWDDAGFPDYAITDWMNVNPGSGLMMNVHTWSGFAGPPQWLFPNGVYGWKNWDPRTGSQNYLATGWEVGITMWPLFPGTPPYHEDMGHCLTMQQILANMTFDCTDSDRDNDWVAPGNVNTYNDASLVQVVAPDTYFGWYNDYYDGNIAVLPHGDVGYVCAIIPEPTAMALLTLGFLVALRRRR